MRSLVLMMLVAFATSVSAQTVQCVDVPKGHKIIFIPTLIPTSEIKWEWSYAKDPVTVEQEDEQVYVPCSDKLVVSPSVCVDGWQVKE